MNNWETSDLSWQEWTKGEGITVITSQALPSEIPHLSVGQTGG